jgi:hypothetical protein
MDAILLWNQRLLGKEFVLPDGTFEGKDIKECICPSKMGFTVTTLTKDGLPNP